MKAFETLCSQCATRISHSQVLFILLLACLLGTTGGAAHAMKSKARPKKPNSKIILLNWPGKIKKSNVFMEYSRGKQIVNFLRRSVVSKELVAKIKKIPLTPEEKEWRANKSFDKSADYSVKRWVRILDGVANKYDVYFSESGDVAFDKIENRGEEGSRIRSLGLPFILGKNTSEAQLVSVIQKMADLEHIPSEKIRSEKSYFVPQRDRYFRL